MPDGAVSGMLTCRIEAHTRIASHRRCVAVNIDTLFHGELNNVDADRADQLPVPGLDSVRP